MRFLLLLVGFLEKWTKSAKSGNFGVLRRGVRIPRSSIGPRQGVVCPRRSLAEREIWTASSTPRCSKATPQRRLTPRCSYCSQHGNFCVLFFFLFCYFEDLSIGLMRTL